MSIADVTARVARVLGRPGTRQEILNELLNEFGTAAVQLRETRLEYHRAKRAIQEFLDTDISEDASAPDYDGAPYCSDCGARKRQHCKCPPRPEND